MQIVLDVLMVILKGWLTISCAIGIFSAGKALLNGEVSRTGAVAVFLVTGTMWPVVLFEVALEELKFWADEHIDFRDGR